MYMVNFDQIVDLRRSIQPGMALRGSTAKKVRPTRARHPDPFVLSPAVQFSTGPVLIREGDQAGEKVAQLATIRSMR